MFLARGRDATYTVFEFGRSLYRDQDSSDDRARNQFYFFRARNLVAVHHITEVPLGL